MNVKLISKEEIIEEVVKVVPGKHADVFIGMLFGTDANHGYADSKKIIQILNRLRRYNKCVLFVSVKTFYNQSLMASKLKRLGYKCFAINLADRELTERDEIFDDVFFMTIEEFVSILGVLKVLIFSQGWLFRYSLNVCIDLFKKNSIHCVDMMDFGGLMFPEPNKELQDKLKIVWGCDAVEKNEMQQWCEEYLLKNADKCLLPGSLNYAKHYGISDEEILNRMIVNYSIEKNFFVTKEPARGLVHAGGIPPFDERRIPEIFADAHMITTVESLYAEKSEIPIVIYNNPLIASYEEYSVLYEPLYDLMKKYKNFKFCRGKEGLAARELIGDYLYGLIINDFSGMMVNNAHYAGIVPTKFYLYLEAGLPVIVSEEFIELASIVRKFELGIVVKQNQLPLVYKMCNEYDNKKYRGNVGRFREMLFKNSVKELSKALAGAF